ncbi:MAG TPA: hypothetical protein PKI89_07030 [Tepidiformaceae bacterium]|nr:hypothetical protein [Tepidiformaceae bacterium]HNO66504.1 hypothetical protein [Tepidiformaceae bacterium]
MATPDFRVIATDDGDGVTYTCGCECVPTARPAADGSPGHEHCCCGKVHFVGVGARSALESYLAERKQNRKREPDYDLGTASIELAGQTREVAWAFPRE